METGSRLGRGSRRAAAGSVCGRSSSADACAAPGSWADPCRGRQVRVSGWPARGWGGLERHAHPACPADRIEIEAAGVHVLPGVRARDDVARRAGQDRRPHILQLGPHPERMPAGVSRQHSPRGWGGAVRVEGPMGDEACSRRAPQGRTGDAAGIEAGEETGAPPAGRQARRRPMHGRAGHSCSVSPTRTHPRRPPSANGRASPTAADSRPGKPVTQRSPKAWRPSARFRPPGRSLGADRRLPYRLKRSAGSVDWSRRRDDSPGPLRLGLRRPSPHQDHAGRHLPSEQPRHQPICPAHGRRLEGLRRMPRSTEAIEA